ncbi:E4 SUMO-protein ligase PIAL2, partial [Mucuna pruriens]
MTVFNEAKLKCLCWGRKRGTTFVPVGSSGNRRVEMNSSSALQLPPDTSPSVVNMYRINKVADRLTWLAQPGNRGEPSEFYNLCLSLSRGIDYALANGETPGKAQDLPVLVKQICQLKNDEFSQAAMMVLMISVKNACEIGWFQTKESEELVIIADEIRKIYSGAGSINAGPGSCSSAISTIMEKFYPIMKIGPTLASIDAKVVPCDLSIQVLFHVENILPGFGASALDFHITKREVLKDKIYLLVAQTDNIETSACLISPQQVNFLLNGKGVVNRTNVQMDPGPQMPTNVTAMLKFGTNLLQAVGQFNGHYVVLVAYMSVTSLPEHPVLQHYIQPAITSVDSDSDIIEGASQISLNCPISFTRIKTPVKGRSCKHFQCFDFYNFINMNSKRPSWRCPHCNQYIFVLTETWLRQILKNVGENITEVIVLADGSWKAVLEKDHDVDKMQKKALNCEKEQTEPLESTCSPSTVDLTNDDDRLEAMDSCEIVDRKPFQASGHSQFLTPNSTSLGMNSTGVNQNVSAQIEDDFWSGVCIGRGRSDTPTVGISELPVLPDTVSPAFNQESAGRDNNPVVNSATHNQFPAPNNLQMQLNHMNSVNEYGRSSSVSRHFNRTPVAVQALPVQSQALGPQQNSITNLNNSLLPGNNSSATSHISLSNPASVDTFNAILSDTERQQHFSRPPRNLPQVSGVNPPAFQHHTSTQNRVQQINMSAPTQLQNPYRAGSLSEMRNPHLQQALNSRPSPQLAMNPRPSPMQGLNSPPWLAAQVRAMAAAPARQGSSQARVVPTAGATTHGHQAMGMIATQPARQSSSVLVQNQSSVGATSFATGLTGEQKRGNAAQSVSRPDELFSLQSEQNWVPTGRMRGSLDLSQRYDDSITQRIIAPSQQSVQSAQQSVQRSQGQQLVRRTSGLPQLDVLLANNRNANAHNRSSSR